MTSKLVYSIIHLKSSKSTLMKVSEIFMYADEILKSEAVNRKKVTKEFLQQAYDMSTGEIISENTVKEYMVGQEPSYIKVYTDSLLIFNDLSTVLSPVLIAFMHHMTWANDKSEYFRQIVRTDAMVREDVSRRTGIGDERIKKIIKEFVNAEVFIPIENKDGKKKRGIYFVNPWVIGKGDWNDIKKLRANFEFVNHNCAITMELENGTRKTIIPLQYRENPKTEKTENDSTEDNIYDLPTGTDN